MCDGASAKLHLCSQAAVRAEALPLKLTGMPSSQPNSMLQSPSSLQAVPSLQTSPSICMQNKVTGWECKPAVALCRQLLLCSPERHNQLRRGCPASLRPAKDESI